MRKHIYTGAMGATYWQMLLAGIIITAFIQTIGLSPYRTWGLLQLFGSLSMALQMLGAHLAARSGRRRGMWFLCAMVSRLLAGLAVLSVYYLAGRNLFAASAVFVVLFSLGRAFDAVATPAWLSWLVDLIPADQHGSFMGRRSAWTSIAAICVLLPSAALIDRATAEGLRTAAFLVVFALGLGIGYLDLFIHRTIPEPRMPAQPRARIWRGIATVLRDRDFRSWLVFGCTASFAMGLGGAMTLFYILDDLGYSGRLTTAVAFTAAVPLAATVLSAKHIGRFIDRAGVRPALTASFLLISFAPMFWFFATKNTDVLLIVAWQFVFGIAAKTSGEAGMKLVMRLPAREDCAMYMAVSTCVQAVAMGLGALAAGEILSTLTGWELHVHGMTLVGFHVLFVLSTALRLVATGLTRFLPAPAEERALVLRAENERIAARASRVRA
jgi:MFS family permease